jgi:peptidoglycan/LPS O-acetylase OafA/YrhL
MMPSMSWQFGLRKITFLRFDGIASGFLMAWIKVHSPRWWVRVRLFTILAAAGSLLLAITLFTAVTGVIGGFGSFKISILFITPAIFALYLPLCDTLGVRWPIFARVIEAISLWSYSLYLCHRPVMMILLDLTGGHIYRTAAADLTLIGSWLLMSFGVAWIVYSTFERPILKWREKKFPGGRV